MSQQEAIAVLNGTVPMPEAMTVEAVFSAAHIHPHPVTPY